MQLHQLRYVVQIGDSGSFSEAAKVLFIAQPSLSQQVIKLEKELGVKLFERRSPSVHLTPAGETFLPIARSILEQMDHLQDEMQQYRGISCKELRIGLLRGWNEPGLVQRIVAYQQSHPGLSLSLIYQSTDQLANMLQEKKLECAFLNEENPLRQHPDYLVHPLAINRFMAIVPRENPLSRKSRLFLKDLEGQRIFMPPPGTVLYNMLVDGLQKLGPSLEMLYVDQRDKWMIRTGISFQWGEEICREVLDDFALLPMILPQEDLCFAIGRDSLRVPVIRELFGLFLKSEDLGQNSSVGPAAACD